MDWEDANRTQEALSAAEQHFLALCGTDEEIDEAALDAAYAAMQSAAANADAAFANLMAVGDIDSAASLL